MNFIKRAFLSVQARKGRSLILFAVFLVVTNLVLAGFAMQNVSETASDFARKKLGVDVTLGLDSEKFQKQAEKQLEENPNERIKIPEISTEAADKLAKSTYVKNFNYVKSAFGLAEGFTPIEVDENAGSVAMAGGQDQDDREMPNISLVGARTTDLLQGFTEGTEEIIKGRGITAEDKGKKVALIEKQLAEENKLKVGDKVKIKKDDGKSTIKVEIIGIFEASETVGPKPPIAFLDPSNKIYVSLESLKEFSDNKDMKGTPIDKAIYYLNDPEQIDAFKAAGKKTDIDFDLFKLDAHDELYKKMVGPIENMAATSKWIIYLVSITGSIILGLIIMLTIKERRKELGILLSIGEKKGKLIGQLLVEVLCVAVLAFSLSIFTGGAVSQKMGDSLLQKEITASEEQENNPGQRSGFVTTSDALMGSDLNQDVDPIDNIDVSVTSKEVMKLGGLGLLIAILSTIIPALSILRLKPKEILLKDE
ncbi:permease [Peribacillus muralis]|uniref:Permease n=1 Tax=Peribacillus muralis TaxID=264697 RepID=A0A1B3XN04_9BACI|nr:ABC transporter permease [Peribacillus muralis]AOH54595.1 permease [Peribacillus muralis]